MILALKWSKWAIRILVSAALFSGSSGDVALSICHSVAFTPSSTPVFMSETTDQALGPVLGGAFANRPHIAMMKKASALRPKAIVDLLIFRAHHAEYLFLKELSGRMKELISKAIFPREMRIEEMEGDRIKITGPEKMVPLSRKLFWENMTAKNDVHSQRTDQQLRTAQRIAEGLPRLAYRMKMAGLFVADRNTNFFSITVLDGALPVCAMPQKLTSNPLEIELSVSGFADKLLHDFEALLSTKKNDVRWGHGNSLLTLMRKELIKNGFHPSQPALGIDPNLSQWEDIEAPIEAMSDLREKAEALADLGVKQASTGIESDRLRSLTTFRYAFQTARLIRNDRHKAIAVLLYVATSQGVASQIDESKPVWELALEKAAQFSEPSVQDDQMLRVLRRWVQILPPPSIALFWHEILRKYPMPLLQIAATAALARLANPIRGQEAWKPLWRLLKKLPPSIDKIRGNAIAGRELQEAHDYELANRAFSRAVDDTRSIVGGYQIRLLLFIIHEQLAVERLDDALQTASLISDEIVRDAQWVEIASMYGDMGQTDKMADIRDHMFNPQFRDQIQKMIDDLAPLPAAVATPETVTAIETPQLTHQSLWDSLYLLKQQHAAERRLNKATRLGVRPSA